MSYVHGLDLISQNRAETKSFYHVDGLGSTRALSDVNGVVTDQYIFDAFGRTIESGSVGSTGNVYLFAGEARDGVTGLDYLRARWMDVGSGRFVSVDPFPGFINEPVTLHRFLYANANPVLNTDPSGELTLVGLLVGVSVIGILAGIATPAFGDSSSSFTGFSCVGNTTSSGKPTSNSKTGQANLGTMTCIAPDPKSIIKSLQEINKFKFDIKGNSLELEFKPSTKGGFEMQS